MEDEIDISLPPINTNTFGIPNEEDLLRVYEVYKTSKETRALLSEKGRETFPDTFIENRRLGTLSDLCVRALAKQGSHNITPLVKEDPLKLRIHYDSIDVDIPLKDCYFINNIQFWRRVVLAKSKDATLLMKKEHEYDWKSKGISMKYVEMVEAASAEFWPEEEMYKLAMLVKEYVKEMHIRKLQSLKDRSFEQYFKSEPDTDFTESMESIDISSDELSTADEEVEEEEDEPTEHALKAVSQAKFDQKRPQTRFEKLPKDQELTIDTEIEEEDEEALVLQSQSKLDLERQQNERRRQRHERNAIRKVLRDERDKKLAAREERHRMRSLKLNQEQPPPEVKKKKKKGKKKIKSVFDIEVEPEPDDGEDVIPDGRNKEKQMNRFKRYKYPPEHCHHIDLSFIRYFENLTTFTLEFLGPDMGLNYHPRHLNFSYDDMIRLAKGLKLLLNLKVFRLRNSRMDTRKVQILSRALKNLETLEVVDFGYDHLEDDCGNALCSLLDGTNLKSLELEHNALGVNTMETLSYALKNEDCAPLQYLGLAHNLLTEYGLVTLCRALVGTDKVTDLNITGIECPPRTIVKFVGDVLLRNHKPLKSLNMSAIPLGYESGRDMVKALNTNNHILNFDCRGCGMDEEAEYEANLIIRRNKYIVANPCMSGDLVTEAEISKCIADIKHPIMAKVLSTIAEQEECIQNRPLRTPSDESVEAEEEQTLDEKYFRLYGVAPPSVNVPRSSYSVSYASTDRESVSSNAALEPFHYDPNSFNDAEFNEYVYQPGPPNRYFYFRQNREPW